MTRDGVDLSSDRDVTVTPAYRLRWPPAHFNPEPRFGLRVPPLANMALVRDGDTIAYFTARPAYEWMTRRLDMFPHITPREGDIIIYANDFPPTPRDDAPDHDP